MSAVAAIGPHAEAIAAQAAFRAVMSAMARPGTVQPLAPRTDRGAAPRPLSAGAAAFALTMLDHETPVWLDPALASPAVAEWLRFHTGAPVASDPAQAAFALIGDPAAMPPLASFNAGTLEYPDRSATLVLQVGSFAGGPALTLSGPGIGGQRAFRASPLPPDFRQTLAVNRGLFPRGADFVFVTDGEVAAIPRSARIAAEGE